MESLAEEDDIKITDPSVDKNTESTYKVSKVSIED